MTTNSVCDFSFNVSNSEGKLLNSRFDYLFVSGVALFSIVAPAIGLSVLLYYTSLGSALLQDLSQNEVLFVLILAGVPLVAMAFIPSFALAAMAGFLFQGHYLAYIVSAVLIFASALLGIHLTSRLTRKKVENIFAAKKSWQQTYQRVLSERSLSLYLFLFGLRIAPHMPFALTNLLVSQSQIGLLRLTIVSTLGLLPRSLYAAYMGSQFQSVEGVLKFKGDGLSVFYATLIFVALMLPRLFRLCWPRSQTLP